MATASSSPNCQSCIYNLKSNDQIVPLGQPIEGDVCGMGKGPTTLPFPKPRQAQESGAKKAASCKDYDRKTTFGPGVFDEAKMKGTPIVAMPDPSTIGTVGMTNPPTSRTCLGCRFFVPPATAVENGLWNVGICSARGVMVPPRQVKAVGSSCDRFDIGPRDDFAVTRMQFLPEFSFKARVASAEASMAREIIDPQDYETDAEVSDEDMEHGIKAWRLIENPDGDHAILLPIFNKDFFDEDEQSKIPHTGDDEHPEEYVDHQGLVYRAAVLWMQLDETPALWGVAGTGKTEFYRHMAWLMGLPFHRISVTASTEVEDLAGKMHFSKDKGTYFEYGRLPKAWMSPGIVCLDEPNVGPPDVWQFIRPLTDNSKQLVLDMNNGERVSRHPMAFLGLAMNPAWDVRNAGAEMLADADGSRLMHIYVELPPEEVEREIIRVRCHLDGFQISDDDLKTVMNIARDLRKLTDNETLPITWGVRNQIKVARALKWFGLQQAYKLAAADYMEPEHQDIIKDTVRAHTKSSSSRKLFDDKTDEATAPPVAKPRTFSWLTSGTSGTSGGGFSVASTAGLPPAPSAPVSMTLTADAASGVVSAVTMSDTLGTPVPPPLPVLPVAPPLPLMPGKEF